MNSWDPEEQITPNNSYLVSQSYGVMCAAMHLCHASVSCGLAPAWPLSLPPEAEVRADWAEHARYWEVLAQNQTRSQTIPMKALVSLSKYSV